VERLKAESEKAMNVTMGVIRTMADRVSRTIETIEDKTRPDEMEIEFSLKLDLEGGTVVPMIAKTTAGGQFNIKFKWTDTNRYYGRDNSSALGVDRRARRWKNRPLRCTG